MDILKSEDDGDRSPQKELTVGFWTLVLFAKIAILAIGLGLILLLGTELTILGIGLLGVGFYVIFRWILTYRRIRKQHDVT